MFTGCNYPLELQFKRENEEMLSSTEGSLIKSNDEPRCRCCFKLLLGQHRLTAALRCLLYPVASAG